ncbi:MAG: hypothetical protein U0Q16_23840 [Bryobacteraceae bacterium]
MRNRAVIVLIAVFVLFVGILIVTAVIARQANPVILDEHGKPRAY